MESRKTAITPTRLEDYPDWYQEVIRAADLAEHGPTRGSMVIKPWGYALWENIQKILDARLKKTGHQNAYFPLLIPLSYLEKEGRHVEGFSKECAVVTHHRLAEDAGGRLIPSTPLEEPLVVRPTSEMIIGAMFAKWIKSYRDLPLLINQWANVVRWEMRPRLFLRTTEFLWQEGHTAHATSQEAEEEALKMIDLYADFLENTLAIPTIKGEKTAGERFPGAKATYTLEAMMQDGKALQAGTSHFLGQNFAKAAQIAFSDSHGKRSFAWTTSWGVTTRLIGGVIMVHGDDDGVVLPPRIASAHVAILPLIHKGEADGLLAYCRKLKEKLEEIHYHGYPLVVKVDEREKVNAGEKVWFWMKRGVPMRIEIGPREREKGYLTIAKRHEQRRTTESQTEGELLDTIVEQLDAIQKELLARARAFLNRNLKIVESKGDLYAFFQREKGFARTYWSGDSAVEREVQRDLNASIRCIQMSEKGGICPFTGKMSHHLAIFAKSY